MHMPVLLQRIDFQAGKQFLLPLKISTESRKQQTLSETSGTAQKVNFSFCCQRIDHIGLIHINKTTFYYLIESLYTNRIFHNTCILNVKYRIHTKLDNLFGISYSHFCQDMIYPPYLHSLLPLTLVRSSPEAAPSLTACRSEELRRNFGGRTEKGET